MEKPRTDSARSHDDNDWIEDLDETPDGSSSSGGNLARDVASKDELNQVRDPDGRSRVTKQDSIDNDTADRSRRVRG